MPAINANVHTSQPARAGHGHAQIQVGERLEYLGSCDGRAPFGFYTITGLLPAEGSDPRYGVKNANEAHERTTRESQFQEKA